MKPNERRNSKREAKYQVISFFKVFKYKNRNSRKMTKMSNLHTRALAFGSLFLSRSNLAVFTLPQWAATCRGVK